MCQFKYSFFQNRILPHSQNTPLAGPTGPTSFLLRHQIFSVFWTVTCTCCGKRNRGRSYIKSDAKTKRDISVSKTIRFSLCCQLVRGGFARKLNLSRYFAVFSHVRNAASKIYLFSFYEMM
jgi:hypothetical protein